VGGSLGLAAATQKFVENPIRFSRSLAPYRALTLAGVGVVTMVTAGTAILWQHSASLAAHSLDHGRIIDAVEDPNGPKNTCPAVGFLTTDVVECVGGDPASKFTIVLFGDSHAGQWFPAFEAIAKQRGWRIVSIGKPACPSARVPILNIFLNRPYTECDAWREAAINRILDMRPAVVAISNRQLQSFSPGPDGPNETWREGSRKTLETLDSAGITTILLRDTPSPGIDIPDCLARNTSWWARERGLGSNACTLDRAIVLNDGMFRAEQDAAAGLEHVHVLDLSDMFCSGAVCPPVKNGIVVYRDESHISAPFARSVAPALLGRLVPLIPIER
jgi:hypothetical protein